MNDYYWVNILVYAVFGLSAIAILIRIFTNRRHRKQVQNATVTTTRQVVYPAGQPMQSYQATVVASNQPVVKGNPQMYPDLNIYAAPSAPYAMEPSPVIRAYFNLFLRV